MSDAKGVIGQIRDFKNRHYTAFQFRCHKSISKRDMAINRNSEKQTAFEKKHNNAAEYWLK